LTGFKDMAGRFVTSPGTATENISGPVGIVVVAKETSALGFVYFLDLLALISVNLAVLNLLPFPALDGGRIVIALIEKMKGSPVPQKVQVAINLSGLAILLVLMVLVTVGDIQRLF
jgi:regulator of sigma E protease